MPRPSALAVGLALGLALGLACTPVGVEIPPELREGAVPLSAERIAVIQGPRPGEEAAVLVSDRSGHVEARYAIDVDALHHLGVAAPGWPRIFAGRARGSGDEVSMIALDGETGAWAWWGRFPTWLPPALAASPTGRHLRVDVHGMAGPTSEGSTCGARSALVDPRSGDALTDAAELADARALHFGDLCLAAERARRCSIDGVGPGEDLALLLAGGLRGTRCGGAGEHLHFYAWSAMSHAVLVTDRGGLTLHHTRASASVLRPPARPPAWLVELADGRLQATPTDGERPGWRARIGPEGHDLRDIFDRLVIDGDLTYALGDQVIAAIDHEGGALLGAARVPGLDDVVGQAGGALWLRTQGARPWIVLDAASLAPLAGDEATPLEAEVIEGPQALAWDEPRPPVMPAVDTRPEPTPPAGWEAALTPAIRRQLGLGRAGDPEVSISIIAWETAEEAWAPTPPRGIDAMVLVAHLGEPIRETVLAHLSQPAGPWQVVHAVRLPGAASQAAIVDFSSAALPEPSIYGWPQPTGERARIGHRYRPPGAGDPRRPATDEELWARLQRGF